MGVKLPSLAEEDKEEEEDIFVGVGKDYVPTKREKVENGKKAKPKEEFKRPSYFGAAADVSADIESDMAENTNRNTTIGVQIPVTNTTLPQLQHTHRHTDTNAKSS
jgi:hypothetical protein